MKGAVETMDFAAGEVLLFDKPLGWTSFDVVGKVRNAIKIKKVGHAGTLDPLATGLLVLCTGKKTKSIQTIQDADKEYIATIAFGATTPSYDAEFAPENPKDISHLTAEMIAKAMEKFIGEIEQMPPAFSALKVGGKRAYESARAGKPVELKPRILHITAFELLSYSPEGIAVTRVHCSKGTYIRSMAHDLGQNLGVGAYLKGLRRTRIGALKVEDAWDVAEFCSKVKELRTGQDAGGGA